MFMSQAIDILEGRHLVQEGMVGSEQYIHNDTSIIPEEGKGGEQSEWRDMEGRWGNMHAQTLTSGHVWCMSRHVCVQRVVCISSLDQTRYDALVTVHSLLPRMRVHVIARLS